MTKKLHKKNTSTQRIQGGKDSLQVTVKQFIKSYIYRIDLDADYQREKVWEKEDRELLLNSIIRNIDIPKMYLAKTSSSNKYDYECIDGKQRMQTLSMFLKPDKNEKSPLTVNVEGTKYTYEQLRKELSKFAKQIEDYILDFVVYNGSDLSDDFIREIFRRLQLGIRLNSGEILNSLIGTIREFVYKEIGANGLFFRHTGLLAKRYAKQFTLAQICINSFDRQGTDNFVRARLKDIEDFFVRESNSDTNNKHLTRIREVLKIMDKDFGEKAKSISSKATAVSAYFFVEDLYLNKKTHLVPEFVKFYIKLSDEIKGNMQLVRKFKSPKNVKVMDGFQRYILQASVEPYAIRRRYEFLKEAFNYYLDPKTKGKIIGGK